jgi:HEAT repeat protein
MALCVCRPDPIAIKPLIKCLRNHFDDFWRSAGNMHGNLGNLHGINNDIQDLCLDSLVEIGPEASGPLIQLLEDSEWDVRSLAAQGLGRLKDKRATEVLIRHLKERDGDVAYRAAKALGEIGDRKAIPALLVALKDDQLDVFARIPAAGALARMGRGEGLKFLQTMLKSRGPNIRGEAADELGTSDNKGALEPLLSLLSDPQYDVSNHAMGALIDLHDPRAVPTLRKFLSDSDARIRHDAAWVLGEIGDPKDIPALRELAKDPDPGVRSSAADAIEKLGAKPSPASQPGKT